MDERTCTIEGCSKDLRARGMCNAHYYHWHVAQMRDLSCVVDRCEDAVTHKKQQMCHVHYRRLNLFGDPLVDGKPDPAQHLAERFWSKVNKGGSGGCWVWMGQTGDQGYGVFGVRESSGWKTRYAHRLSYEMQAGEIPEGLVIDHLCRVRSCVNPRHLEPVKQRENVLRGVAPSVLTVKLGYCQRGHAMTPDNVYVRPDGSRRWCRACRRIRDNRRYRERAQSRIAS